MKTPSRLAKALQHLCARNRRGSFSTQATRRAHLKLVARQLKDLGYGLTHPKGMKPKHIEALVECWQKEGLGSGTMKNRLASVRWLCERVGKASIVKSNDEYGIGSRSSYNGDRGRKLDLAALDKVSDPHARMAVRLMAAFGLRREEAIKFRPDLSDKGARLAIKVGTKGGRYREVPVLLSRQRALLEEAKALAGKGSLIPSDKSYKQQLEVVKHQCARAGIRSLHGLRHNWAQAIYRHLTGWRCPAAGGRVTEISHSSKRQKMKLHGAWWPSGLVTGALTWPTRISEIVDDQSEINRDMGGSHHRKVDRRGGTNAKHPMQRGSCRSHRTGAGGHRGAAL